MTITEKIIAAHAGTSTVEPGEYVTVKVDVVMDNELSTAGAIGVLRKMEARRVFDPARIVVVLDHVAPTKDIAAASMLKGEVAAPGEVA